MVFGDHLTPERDLTPHQYLAHFERLRGRSPSPPELSTWFQTLKLDSPHVPISALSTGNARKVELIRALRAGTSLLVLDEPTRELDLVTKLVVWEKLRERASAGVGILLASHDATEIARLCSRVVVLREGRVVWTGVLSDRTAQGVTEELVRLLGGDPRS